MSTRPASRMAPPASRSCSDRVVLPASTWASIPKTVFFIALPPALHSNARSFDVPSSYLLSRHLSIGVYCQIVHCKILHFARSKYGTFCTIYMVHNPRFRTPSPNFPLMASSIASSLCCFSVECWLFVSFSALSPASSRVSVPEGRSKRLSCLFSP